MNSLDGGMTQPAVTKLVRLIQLAAGVNKHCYFATRSIALTKPPKRESHMCQSFAFGALFIEKK